MHGLVHCCAFHILYSTWCNTSGTLALFQASGHLVVHHDCPFNQLVLLQFSISQLHIEGAGIIHSTDLSGTVRARQPVGEGPKIQVCYFISQLLLLHVEVPWNSKIWLELLSFAEKQRKQVVELQARFIPENLFWALNAKKRARWSSYLPKLL